MIDAVDTGYSESCLCMFNEFKQALGHSQNEELNILSILLFVARGKNMTIIAELFRVLN
jgi:hypothetical protein